MATPDPNTTTTALELGRIAMELFGGLALFLFGMGQMTDALKIVAGDGMRNLLSRLTTNRWKALFAGAFVTSIIQSSSVTTVLVVGFISAGLMSLSQSIGVILGADIGTTVTAHIVAFKVTRYALVLVALGFAMLFCFRNDKIRHWGNTIMGLGLIFFGMSLMSEGMKPLRDYAPMRELLQEMASPPYVTAIIAGALFTALVQSSSAAIAVVIVMAGQGLITLEAGIALALGANIGTCVTALLASIGKPRAAVRAAVVHVVFKVVGVLIWVAFIGQLAWLVERISLGAGVERKIAVAHTIFNVANALLFIGFTDQLASLMVIVVPDKRAERPKRVRPLDEILLQTPTLALHLVRTELGRLGAGALRLVQQGLPAAMTGTKQELDELQRIDDEIDEEHAEIITYLGRLAKKSLGDAESEQLHDDVSAANYFESIGDIVETNLYELGVKRLEHRVEISTQTQEVLGALHARVAASVESAAEAIATNDVRLAESIMRDKDEINRLALQAERHLLERLAVDRPNRLEAFRVESEIIELLKRIYYFSKRIAKLVAETEPRNVDVIEEHGLVPDGPAEAGSSQ